jgi:hypothetical protein
MSYASLLEKDVDAWSAAERDRAWRCAEGKFQM